MRGIYRAYVPHLENVYSNLRQQLHRMPEDKMEDLDVNTLIVSLSKPHQKSATTKSETIVRCVTQVDQGSERNRRHVRDRLATEFLETDDLFN